MNLSLRNIVFCPHPGAQTAFVQSPVFETVYGGARGGGKTFACLGEFIIHGQEYKSLAKGLFLRRTRESLKDAIREAKKLYKGLGIWKATRNEFQFFNGSVLIFNYLDKDDDADQYQGHQYTRIYIEELTQFPDPAPIKKMFATLRSADGVPCQFRASCNPGGAGHSWVKARYIDIGPYQITADDDTGLQRVFIPAKIADNPTLLQNDPLYIMKLRMVGSEALVNAWLNGDWSIIEGAFFSEFSERKHMLPHADVEAAINGDWRYFAAGDWGSARPYAFAWYAVVPDMCYIADKVVPRGAIIRIREMYGMKKGEFNVGVKLPAEIVGRDFVMRTDEKLTYGVLDPSAFKQDGGPSIAERLASVGARFRPADNKRVARAGAFGGWDMCRFRLIGEDDTPMFYVTERSPHFLRTVPVLQHDENRMEDLDTESEDHIADEWRYAMMSRPWIPRDVKKLLKNTNPFTAENAFWGDIINPKEPERVRLN